MAVTRVGITGHQDIPAAAREAVEAGIRHALAQIDVELAGIGSLAAGADQIFAATILDMRGQLEVVIPCGEYETTFDTPAKLTEYNRLLTAATSVEWLDYPTPSEEAFMAAGIRVVDRCDLLVAVWDGKDAQGLGGTADVVRHARKIDRVVVVIWPAGISRA